MVKEPHCFPDRGWTGFWDSQTLCQAYSKAHMSHDRRKRSFLKITEEGEKRGKQIGAVVLQPVMQYLLVSHCAVSHDLATLNINVKL